MTENTTLNEVQVTPDSAVDAAKTAGQLLKAARLHAGMHLAVLSVNLKIPVRQLEALEADEYPLSLSPVFVRGLASSVCRQLRTDPTPILALLPHGDTYLEPHGAVRQAYVRPTDLGRIRVASPHVPARAWWAAASMLAMIAALIWLPSPTQWAWLGGLSAHLTSSGSGVKTVTSEPDTQVSTVPTEAAPLGAVTVVPTVSVVPASTPTVTTAVEMPVSIQNPPSLVPSAPVPHSTAASAATPQLQFSAADTCWIEVRDVKNRVLWSGVLKAGEKNQVSASEIVNVVVGRADVIQVTFKGQVIDLKPHTKVNVARFEVKP